MTVRGTRRLVGLGVHSGLPCAVTIRPAPVQNGIRINGSSVHVDAVVQRPLCTALQTPGGLILTIEHLMAALWGQGVDDVDVEVEGGEIPILDGSAKPWLDVIELKPHGGRRTVLAFSGAVEVSDGRSWIRATESDQLHLRVELDYPELGAMCCEGHLDELVSFGTARTFGFERDAQRLIQSGLAQGANLDNTIVFDEGGRPLNEDPLRHPHEPARHKWLDLVGDLALCGHRLHARIESHRGGHGLNQALVRRLVEIGTVQVS